MSNPKLITMSQCRDLRMMINQLTQGCMLTEEEYKEFCILINKVLNRMEAEESGRIHKN